MAGVASYPPLMHPHASETLTAFAGGNGAVSIRADPFFLQERHESGEGRYIFAYQIRVRNEGRVACQLLWRRWEIMDGEGLRREVHGSGVIGRQPRLEPGESFEYRSFSPLATPTGSMRGAFAFVCDDGSMFEAPIGEFLLVASGETMAGDGSDERPDRPEGRPA